MNSNNIVIGSIDNPTEAAAIGAQIEKGERNVTWLGQHGADFLAQARGKFIVVAAQ